MNQLSQSYFVYGIRAEKQEKTCAETIARKVVENSSVRWANSRKNASRHKSD